MKISQLLKQNKRSFSFEFFPPKTEKGQKELLNVLAELEPLKPDFVSVTNSPLSADPMKTVNLATLSKNNFSMETMAHLTCISSTKTEINEITGALKNHNIKNVLALRGDLPNTPEGISLMRRDFKHANELVAHLASDGYFDIGVAGYPETHPESDNQNEDLDNLKRKIDSGASFIITQLFFDNKTFLEFKNLCLKKNINVPVIAGIMPITGYNQIERFTKTCSVNIPQKLYARLEEIKNDAKQVETFGINYAVKQINELLEDPCQGIHFYTLNKSRATIKILKQIKN